MAKMIILDPSELQALLWTTVQPLAAKITDIEQHVRPDAGRLLTLEEAGQRVGFSPKTVKRWIIEGCPTPGPNGRPGPVEKLPHCPITGTDIRIRLSDLDAFVAKFRQTHK